ncbi:MAG: hypothetical protein K5644_06855 [Lachnospiraceae bacterium]|nr:hypothetical protein [Lachnospiraceae bacterium]
MKRFKSIVLSAVLVSTLIITGGLTGCSKSSDNSSKTNSSEAKTNSSDSKSTAEEFGNYHPAMPQVSYIDEEAKIINNGTVPDEYEQPATHQGKLQYEDYKTKDYDDDEHEMEKYLVVYTPYGYDPSKEYDIMYLTHGHTGGATTWLGSPTESHEAKHVLDHLIEDGKVRPMIVVSMTYYDDNTDENTSDYDKNLLDFFGKELRNDIIPMVESKYSTYAKSLDYEGFKASRNHRIMGGFSMGGVTTNLQICESMDYFKYYMPVSGSLYWSNFAFNDKNFDAGSKMSELITQQGYGHDDFYIYISTGTLDFAKRIVERQVSSMKNSDMFTYGKPGEEGVNCSYGLGTNEGHNAHGRETAMFNALPALSALIGAQQ